jgi:hypothetical protein
VLSLHSGVTLRLLIPFGITQFFDLFHRADIPGRATLGGACYSSSEPFFERWISSTPFLALAAVF